ncbi:MAG: stage III sporulation protein AA [Bacillota bacterium]
MDGVHAAGRPTGAKLHVLFFLPPRIASLIERLPAALVSDLKEIRLRVGRPVVVTDRRGRGWFVGPHGPAADPLDAATFRQEDAAEFLQIISRSSVYALEEEFRQGFVTLPGGHRVGLCGEVAVADGRPRTLRHVGSFTVRVAREVPGAADAVLPKVAPGGASPRHTLVISPPGGGKTTLLRDLARQLAARWQVAVIDERSEIAACWHGVPQLDVGPCTDVLDRCPKAAGVMQVLRGMAPQVIITDEIGRPEDAAALLEAMNAGVAVVASAHGSSLEEVAARPALRALFDPCGFDVVVVLGGARAPGTVTAVVEPVKRRTAALE